MPVYGFKCKKCKLVYEDLADFDESGKYKDVNCPKCNSKSKDKLLNSCKAVIFKQKKGTSKENNFEYVAKHNMEMAKKTRQMAEEKSHMGPNVYSSLDDVSSGNNFDNAKW